MKTRYYLFCGFPTNEPVALPSVRVMKSEFDYAVSEVSKRFPDASFEWRPFCNERDEALYINGWIYGVRKRGC